MKLSVIVPARKEPLLQRTIDSFLAASELGGEVEIIAALDGPYMDAPVGNGMVKCVRLGEPQGMRGAINAGLAIAKGDYVMKLDAHCSFGQGFDRIMLEAMEDDWLMIPRRFPLDDTVWKPTKIGWPRDYHYIHLQDRSSFGEVMTPQRWPKRNDDLEIDDTMTFQGSCWLAKRDVFMDVIGFLDDRRETYGQFAAEQFEVGLKYWLSGREVKVNKRTWYAHLWKMPRHYGSGEYEKKRHGSFKTNWYWATKHWTNDREPGMVRSFEWLLDKFWPVPSWPEDRSQWKIS